MKTGPMRWCNSVEQIRKQLVVHILQGPKPPSDEMALLSREYQELWRTRDETATSTAPVTLMDRLRCYLPKSEAPDEYALKRETERLHRKKRRTESEQIASLHRTEGLLVDNENWRQRLLKQNRRLAQEIERCRAESEQTLTPAQAVSVRREIQDLVQLHRQNSRKLAELNRCERRLLAAVRRSVLEYLDLIKRLEAHQEHGRLSLDAASKLDPFVVLGAVLTLSRFNDMARNINKLANQR